MCIQYSTIDFVQMRNQGDASIIRLKPYFEKTNDIDTVVCVCVLPFNGHSDRMNSFIFINSQQPQPRVNRHFESSVSHTVNNK